MVVLIKVVVVVIKGVVIVMKVAMTVIKVVVVVIKGVVVLIKVVDRNCLVPVVGLLSRRGLTSGTVRWFELATEVLETDDDV